MKHRSIIALTIIFTMVVAYFLLSPTTDPLYQGRRLSTWLRDFDADDLQARVRASNAVRQIGTNALPLIIQRLRQSGPKPSSSTLNIRATINRLLSKQSLIPVHIPPPGNPRRQALAAIDALGPAGSNALPVLAELLHETPPDSQTLYVIARIGQAGDPILRQALTNEERIIRMAAEVCLARTNSVVASQEPSFDRRICEFNLRMLQKAFQEYKTQHPEQQLPNDISDKPPPSQLPPGFTPLPIVSTNHPSKTRPPRPAPSGPDIYE